MQGPPLTLCVCVVPCFMSGLPTSVASKLLGDCLSKKHLPALSLTAFAAEPAGLTLCRSQLQWSVEVLFYITVSEWKGSEPRGSTHASCSACFLLLSTLFGFFFKKHASLCFPDFGKKKKWQRAMLLHNSPSFAFRCGSFQYKHTLGVHQSSF